MLLRNENRKDVSGKRQPLKPVVQRSDRSGSVAGSRYKKVFRCWKPIVKKEVKGIRSAT
ncbi:hypothetical protein [Botryobacter ruber]|uniref:hypothetical protein n=1 Tax=Botryobacter ruber TaxID=2171629 RepID=UPI0013E2DD28|nr:hypothetical protein [Botryobacter ruber]